MEFIILTGILALGFSALIGTSEQLERNQHRKAAGRRTYRGKAKF